MNIVVSSEPECHVTLMTASNGQRVPRKCPAGKTVSLGWPLCVRGPEPGLGMRSFSLVLVDSSAGTHQTFSEGKFVRTGPQPPSCLSHLTSCFTQELECLFIANLILGFLLANYFSELQYLEDYVHALGRGRQASWGLESTWRGVLLSCSTYAALFWSLGNVRPLFPLLLLSAESPTSQPTPWGVSSLKTHSSTISSLKVFLIFSLSIPTSFRLFVYITILCMCVWTYMHVHIRLYCSHCVCYPQQTISSNVSVSEELPDTSRVSGIKCIINKCRSNLARSLYWVKDWGEGMTTHWLDESMNSLIWQSLPWWLSR